MATVPIFGSSLGLEDSVAYLPSFVNIITYEHPFESAGSQHVSGAQFTCVDGSVHFFNENMDSKVFAYLGSMADGEANYNHVPE